MDEKLLQQLGKMSAAELDELIAFAKDKRKGKKRPAKLQGDDWLFDGLADFLINHGKVNGNWRYSIQQNERYLIYLKKRDEAQAFLAELIPEGDSRARAQLMRLVAIALSDLLTERQIFYPSTMLSRVDLIPEAIDRAFPGYVQAGLFRSILLPDEERPKKMSRDRFELVNGNRILDTETHDDVPKDNRDIVRFLNHLVEEKAQSDRGRR